MKTVGRLVVQRIFNYKDPKAWGSVLVLIAALAIKYLPGGDLVVAFVKSNPEEIMAILGAIAGALGLWNQKQKATALDKLTEGEPKIVS